MRKLSEFLPILNIFEMANPENGIIDDDKLPEELSSSLKTVDAQIDRHFGKPNKQGMKKQLAVNPKDLEGIKADSNIVKKNSEELER